MQLISIEVDGVKVLKIDEFARITERSEGSIRQLIYKGNRIRQLKTIKVGCHSYIPLSEVTDFPFTPMGRPETYVYKFKWDEELEKYVPYLCEEA